MTERTTRRATLALFFAGILAGCNKAPDSSGAQTSTQTETPNMDHDIEGLKHAEQTWARSLTESDAKLLATIIDAQFSFIGPDGQVENREAYLAGYEAMEKMQVKVGSIDMDQVAYRVLGDVGIVTGHVLAKVEMQGQPLTEDVRFTRVYRRSDQGWKMVAGQGTRIAAGPPAGRE